MYIQPNVCFCHCPLLLLSIVKHPFSLQNCDPAISTGTNSANSFWKLLQMHLLLLTSLCTPKCLPFPLAVLVLLPVAPFSAKRMFLYNESRVVHTSSGPRDEVKLWWTPHCYFLKIPHLIKLYFWWATQVCNKNTLKVSGVYILLKKIHIPKRPSETE